MKQEPKSSSATIYIYIESKSLQNPKRNTFSGDHTTIIYRSAQPRQKSHLPSTVPFCIHTTIFSKRPFQLITTQTNLNDQFASKS
jgi:hypothetical protein